jgi:hypothetical protein
MTATRDPAEIDPDGAAAMRRRLRIAFRQAKSGHVCPTRGLCQGPRCRAACAAAVFGDSGLAAPRQTEESSRICLGAAPRCASNMSTVHTPSVRACA